MNENPESSNRVPVAGLAVDAGSARGESLRTVLEQIEDECSGALNNAFPDEAPNVLEHVLNLARDALKSAPDNSAEITYLKRRLGELRIVLANIHDSTQPSRVFAHAEADALKTIRRFARDALSSPNDKTCQPGT